MLKVLTIKNIALIDGLEIEFSSGLTILTGETGAGKSIIIDSLNFVLGARADKSLIRYNTDQAVVEAEFDAAIGDNAKIKFAEYDIEYDDGVIISRSLNQDGRSVCRINGIKVSASVLKEIASLLVDIYGQHDTTQLFNPSGHLSVIDSYGKSEIDVYKDEFIKVYGEYKSIIAKLHKYGSLTNVKKRMEEVSEDIDYIEGAKLKIGEESELAERLKVIESSEDIINGIDELEDNLSGEDGAIKLIYNAMRSIRNYIDADAVIGESLTRLESSYYEIKDIVDVLIRDKIKFDYNEHEANKINDRLNTIRATVKAYGGDESTAINKLIDYKNEYDFLANSEFDVIQLNKQKAELHKILYIAACKLSEIRRKSAFKFEQGVLSELAELNMSRTKFKAEFSSLPSEKEYMSVINNSGIDSMEFLISPNPGQPLKPLSKIISGGEMSRFMLAIKKLTADIDGVNVMIFDEVDSGISGDVALVVAKKLSDLSHNKQVLAITHLPQLASFADRHYYVDKVSDDESTKSSIKLLDNDGMIRELGRLIGGAQNSALSIEHAREIKNSADKYKLMNKES